MNNSKIKNSAVLGLALFAMFFGAGNLIFPPVIGLEGGTDWLKGYITYFIADVGLAFVSVIAMIRTDGDMNKVTGSVGKVPAIILNTAIIACIGPLLAIPRAAATSFEMASTALFGGSVSPLALPLFSVAFFLVIYLLSMNPSHVISSVGKVLTPLLVITLAVLIVAGIANPAAPAAAPTVSNILQEGVLNGYQTMDMLAALAFSIIAVQTVKGFGYKESRLKFKVILVAMGIAAVLLLVVYGSLAYLGATTGQLWSAEFMAGQLNQAGLLANISKSVLGMVGAVFLVAIVLFACITTVVGLVASCSEYFQRLLGERVTYRAVCRAICAFSLVVCNIGLSQIISFSAPILLVVYPVALFLTIASLFRKEDGPGLLACKFGAAVALVISLCTVLVDMFGVTGLSAIHTLPLDTFGFNWLVPTAVAALVGLAVEKAMGAKA